MINIIQMVLRANPHLKRELRMARIPKSPEEFAKRTIRLALMVSVVFSLVAFFAFSKQMGVKVIPVMLIAFLVSMFLVTAYILQTPKGYIRKRQKEIDREVLFSGRYLLVKMESGSPLFNSLIDASKSFGTSAKYFREIVDEINTGTPIEVSLESIREYSPSQKFKKILWQILASLKTGTEVTEALRSTLKSIAKEQMLEIKEYGKKLNSLMLFYMVMACIVPSLGVAMFIIVASFISLEITKPTLFAILFAMVVMQGFFVIMIKASRPAVDM